MGHDGESEYARAEEVGKVANSQVELVQNRLENVVGTQQELLHMLDMRLTAILIPEHDEKGHNEPEDVLVPLAARLRVVDKTVQRNNEQLRSILDRIQL